MIRDEIRRLQRSLHNASSFEKVGYLILIFIALMIIIGLINLQTINETFKLILFIAVPIIIAGVAVSIYYHQRSVTPLAEQKQRPVQHRAIDPKAVPPMPINPPTISAEKNIDNDHSEDFEIADKDVIMKYKEENPSMYRRPFSIKPVIFKIAGTVAFWIGFLIGAIAQNNSVLWWILGGASIFVPLYCYYLVLRWKGEEFVVNDIWFERPLTMPFPFPSKTPAIRRSEIGKYEFKQTTIDKLLGTCRLYSDTPSAHDKSFHNVKWLTHPAELRRATGISAPRKNSWLSPFRKNKE